MRINLENVPFIADNKLDSLKLIFLCFCRIENNKQAGNSYPGFACILNNSLDIHDIGILVHKVKYPLASRFYTNRNARASSISHLFKQDFVNVLRPYLLA